MRRWDASRLQTFGLVSAGFLLVFGAALRLYQITQSQFIFYDEGYYLNFSRALYERLLPGWPQTFRPLLDVWIRMSLGTGKALWFLMSDVRIFFGGYRSWFFPRVLSALAGIATLGLTYAFARRCFNSRRIALLSAALLAVLPSHVFYSRLAMQEAFSTLCLLGAFFVYCFPRRFGWRTFLAGVLFGAAYFTNYRLIVLPVHIAVCEVWLSFAEERAVDVRKYVWAVLTFAACVVLIGNLFDGHNTYITFAWMFYQSNLAQHDFDWINFLSYPYYLFRLENVLLGALFFANGYLVWQRRWRELLPFILAGVHMMIYSFASEKGARYLCVMLPFVVMAVAVLVRQVWILRTDRRWQAGVLFVLAIMIAGMGVKSTRLALARSDYQPAVGYLLAQDPQMKALATQNYVLNLYVRDSGRIRPVPAGFAELLALYQQGYRYMVLGPQSFISFTADGERFTPELKGYLGLLSTQVPPVKTFTHFGPALLERFVMDHNANLRQTLRFLRQPQPEYGQLRIYRLETLIHLVDRLVGLEAFR